MLAKYRVQALTALCFVTFAGASWGQISAIEGDVKGPDGQPLKGAQILIERIDMKGVYKGAKSDKKGHYIYNGLPLGKYKVSVLVDGAVKDSVNNIQTKLGDPTAVNFDLKQSTQQQDAIKKAVTSGQELSKDQERSLTKEQKDAIEKARKENAASLAKNKALNDKFNAGKDAMTAKDYDTAVKSFEEAETMDNNQHDVIWGNLAEAYAARAGTKTGADQSADLDKAGDAFMKAITLKGDDPAYHNNYALALAKQKKIPEAESELTKAAQFDPTNAGKYYYNLGAVLVNIGQLEPAGDAFKKAIDLDPNYADAQYQYGVYLISKAKTTPDGKIVPPPGTIEALQKYLELKPDGANAEAAKGMLATIQGGVQTTYKNPDTKTKGRKNQ